MRSISTVSGFQLITKSWATVSLLASVDLNHQNVAYYSHNYGTPRTFNKAGADHFSEHVFYLLTHCKLIRSLKTSISMVPPPLSSFRGLC